MSEHTPTPWRSIQGDKIVNREGYFIANTNLSPNCLAGAHEAEANAAFIVKAVNAWYDINALYARIKELEGK